MKQKELLELLERENLVVKTSLYKDKLDEEVVDITYNSKACRINGAFFVKGLNFKEEYLAEALNAGVSIVVTEKEYDTKNAGLIVVNDIRKAMVIVAEVFFDKAYEKLNMIGLTGTKGKTTTATFIHNIFNEYLGKKTALLSTIETYTGKRLEESHLSTPEAIELQRYIKEAKESELEYLTMEVSSQAYKIQRILNMPFDIGLFLNIAEDHISPAEHPNFTDYLNSKLEFIKNCKKVVINYETDNLESVLDSAKNAEKIITYGSDKVKGKVDYYYTNLIKENGKLVFDVVSNEGLETYRTSMMGDFNAGNATAAVIIAKIFGVPCDIIRSGIEKTIVSGRMNVFKKDNKTIIVDYAHNKLSFEKFFEAVKQDYTGNVIAVFGAPGGKAYTRRKDMAEVVSKYCTKVYLTTDDPQFEDPREICNEISTFLECPFETILDRKAAIEIAFSGLNDGDVLCLMAKGEDRYQQVKGKFEPYESDIDIAKKLTE